ncbi:TMEM175 family protein [Roseiterribacter gracilis]|uniref:DUF1211 domain-containing protein n=1 Tax=Roseiterribacter gracilis TaxID=2812848 RepID=A0A8S8XDK3_9PROT|nr:hypothetical protein TMPK1_16540 [Rhodospirillales bacterium TMPK1]
MSTTYRRDPQSAWHRWRGTEITRLEALSDAVFAFAVTLLVVSLEVPKNIGELLHLMRGFLPFSICFAMLFWIWYQHNLFFRRFALQDRFTSWTTAALLFVVLFYVYPMKFVWTSFIDSQIHGDVSNTSMSEFQFAQLMTIYSGGFAAVFVIFAALYAHALKQRNALELTPTEAHLAREEIQSAGINAGVGVLSVILAWTTHDGWFSTAPYWFIGIFQGFHGSAMRRQRERRFAS